MPWDELKDFFAFSYKERKGSIFLFLLSTLILFYPKIHELFFPPTIPDYSLALKSTEWIWLNDLSTVDSLTNEDSRYSKFPKENDEPVYMLFPFNPNFVSDTELTRLGVPGYAIRSIRNFLNKGGSFKTKSDFQKMRCIKSELYKKLTSFIQLPDSIPQNSQTFKRELVKKIIKTETQKIELNSADSVTLISLRGVGGWTASKIIRYREKCGGFYAWNQLFEIKGLDSARFQLIMEQTFLDPSNLAKLHLNADSIGNFARHPYIGYKKAKMIVNFRKEHKRFNQLDEIKKAALLDDELYSKLAPYLTLD